MKIKVDDILKQCNAKLIVGDKEKECLNFCKDTRIIQEHDVYVGIKGDNFDGNDFYDEAFNKGADICILDKLPNNLNKEKYSDKTIILVDDTIKCLQALAAYKRTKYNIPVIAITGSVGKTSTKDMVASVLSQKYNVLKTTGNNNNHIGLPLTILKLKDHNCLVLEMGMNHFKELSVLTNIAKPDVAVITNVTTSHIGNLGSRENILKAKLEILEGLNPNGLLIINNDNDLLHREKDKLSLKYNVKTIGIINKSDYMATEIKEYEDRSTFKIENNDIECNIATRAYIYNSLVAYAVGKYYNVPISLINKGIKETELTKNRLAKITTKRGFVIIDDTYNASFDAMKSAIELLGITTGKRRIAILGDMLELGDYSESIHREIGRIIVKNNIDILITIGDLSKYIKDEAIKNGFDSKKAYSFNKQEETYELLDKILTKGDVVLLKGSHAINLTKIVEVIKKY